MALQPDFPPDYFSETSAALLVFVFQETKSFPITKQPSTSYIGVFPHQKLQTTISPSPPAPYFDNTNLHKGRKTVSDLSIASRKENKMLGLCQLYCLGTALAMKAPTTIIAIKKFYS